MPGDFALFQSGAPERIATMLNTGYPSLPPMDGKCNPAAAVKGENYRFTVLTDRLLRMEYSPSGIFEDRPSQVVWYRNFSAPEFQVIDQGGSLEIVTKYFHVFYNKKEFNANNLYIDCKYAYTNYGGRWRFGQTSYSYPPRSHNLKGTARTLDRINGSLDLDDGLLDSSGRSFFDDSTTWLLGADGWVAPRTDGNIDVYYMGYGHDYYGAIKDFYRLTGAPAFLPRYALGNWWSRFWQYSAGSYQKLFETFGEKNIPFSIAVLDMDWHLVDIPEEYGQGWTGYTWNQALFPKPAQFLDWLHGKGLHVTLNLHPADGIRAYEDCYPQMAKQMGLNPESGVPVQFDIGNPDFLDAYFNLVLHPLEHEGVDFWWMDWQQGATCDMVGLDPLWMLNHYHSADIQRSGNRPVYLSRYSGLGSHRYGIGFSGDTIVSWESLNFQPYFTATASNVGYTCWSHDIGGHMEGVRDTELMVRWIQYGVFSPINRLHSSRNPFCGKEPWLFEQPNEKIIEDFLRLRHRLIPYWYTQAYRMHQDLIPWIVPLYYRYPDEGKAYRYPNQYFFGSELMVCPITSPCSSVTKMAGVKAWLPAGLWTDFLTGTVYRGGRELVLNRPLSQIPVLSRAGAIVPLAGLNGSSNETGNPEEIEILIFPGANNAFSMFEDEGNGSGWKSGAFATTRMQLEWTDQKAVFFLLAEGDLSLLPKRRQYSLVFRGFPPDMKVSCNYGFDQNYCMRTHSLRVVIKPETYEIPLSVTLEAESLVWRNESYRNEQVFQFLDRCQMPVVEKTDIYSLYQQHQDITRILSSLNAMSLEKPVMDALTELTLLP